MSNRNLYLIYHRPAVVEQDIVDALADQVVPGLKKLIETSAAEIAARYESDSPFAPDVAAIEMITRLIGFLALDQQEAPEDHVQLHQMEGKFVHWWLDVPSRAKE